MSSQAVSKSGNRNVEGILHRMEDYLVARKLQTVRLNPDITTVIDDIVWIHLEILSQILEKMKPFGGEKYKVADILAGADESKKRALLSISDQNSIMDEIINRTDDHGKKSGDCGSITDMRTLFRAVSKPLENVVILIQNWIIWDLADAADLHHFDNLSMRLKALKSNAINDQIKARYKPALGKRPEETVSDDEILQFELHQMDILVNKFKNRRAEDEPYQMIIKRDKTAEGNEYPFDYKKRQAEELAGRFEGEKRELDGSSAAGTSTEATAENSAPLIDTIKLA